MKTKTKNIFRIFIFVLVSILLIGCEFNMGGSTYKVTGYEIVDDEKATLTLTKGSIEVVIDATYEKEEKEAKCEVEGIITYTITGIYEEKTYEYKAYEAIDALGHDYKLKEWVWEEYQAKAILECSNCGDTIEVDATVEKEEIPATCDRSGLITYTASISYDGRSYTDFLTEVLPAINHDYKFSRFIWAEDYSSCLLEMICQNDNSHVQTITMNISISEVPATQTAEGLRTYTASVVYKGTEYSDSKEEVLPIIVIEEGYRISYDLGFNQFDTKDDLYNAFYTDYYYFLIGYTDCDMSQYSINSVEDFLVYCKNWNANGRSEMAGLGNAFGRYYMTKIENGTLDSQPTSTFVGYIYQQGKYIDLLKHLEVFFGYWRTDEGYSAHDEHGNDFFYSPWASFVDTCKFFYFTSATITDTYSWYTIERSPRVHYMLDNIPGVFEVDLPVELTEEFTLPELNRMHYNFIGWFDDDNNPITSVYSYNNQIVNVHAKFEAIMHEVSYHSNGSVTTTLVLDGSRLPSASYAGVVNAGYDVYKYVDKLNNEIDYLNAVVSDLDVYVLWYKVVESVGSIPIYSYNTQTQTSQVNQYMGPRLYINGKAIDASLYWYKIGLKATGDGTYYVSFIGKSGEATNSDYEYLILVYSGDDTGNYGIITTMGIVAGDIIMFSSSLDSLTEGEVTLSASVIRGEEDYNNLVLVDDGAINFSYIQNVSGSINLPTIKKNGYTFEGWYKDANFTDGPYEVVNASGIVFMYAKWEAKEVNSALDLISDGVSSYTYDQLPSEYNGKAVSYSSSNSNLYTIENGVGHTNRLYQTHTLQYVDVTVTYDGKEYSKTITIEAVSFDDMDHPKATYFAVSSISSYLKYSERYKTEGTIFSDTFKENFNMVYYAFASPNSDGTVSFSTTYLNQVMELKNHGIRVLLVINGATSEQLKNLVTVCGNASTRATFVNNIMQNVVDYNFDGVDIDWEFPGILSSQAGYEAYTTAVDIKNFNSLIKELRERMTAIQDKSGTPYMLTAATPPTYWGVDRFDYATMNKYLDYVNMMSYDLNKSSTTSHVAHVHIPSNSYSYSFSCEYGINYYASLGLDKSKIILGAAAYGKAYKVTGTVNMSATYPALGVSGTLGQVSGYNLAGQSVTWNSGTIYYTGIQTLINSGNFTQYNEYNSSNKFVGSYLYSPSDKYFITFDSVLGITEKCNLAASYPGMGIMFWSYGEDATDTLVNTISNNL